MVACILAGHRPHLPVAHYSRLPVAHHLRLPVAHYPLLTPIRMTTVLTSFSTLNFNSLKTSDNVTLWQKEKARVLAQHDETIRQLKEELTKVQAQKDSLKHKLEDQGDALKMEKMRVEMTKKRSSANLPPGSWFVLLSTQNSLHCVTPHHAVYMYFSYLLSKMLRKEKTRK